MIWWKGNGMWLGLIVALIIVGAGRALGTKNGIPAGCVSAAALMFALRGSAGQDSSLFSVPVRIWPYLLLALAALTYFQGR